ncbi:hypothetical protein [Mesorhizobium sp. M0130]|uniref:hypothetical protein n=1 Tax=Mesorhizobium sp. M0130 TaxID=2956887 RepID=UPI0033394E5D
MPNDSPKLSVDLEARVTAFERQLKKATATADRQLGAIEKRGSQMTAKLESTMAASAARLAGIGKTLVTAFGFGALLGGLSTLPGAVREVVRGLGDLADAADKIGLPVEQLEAFRYGAQLAGVDASSLDDALAKFTKTIGEASAKGNDFSKILEQNSVALKNADGSIRPVADLLAAYADLIKNAGSETEQMFLATTAFGRGGGDMVNFLRAGSEGLDAVTAAAKAAGVVLGDDLVRAAAAVDDTFDDLAMRMDSVFKTQVVEGIQTVQSLIERFEALPGAIEGAWNSFEGFWNNLASISPEDVAADKLRRAMNAAAVNGTQPWKDGFSVQDMDFGPAAPKGDRLGAPPRRTVVSIPSGGGTKAAAHAPSLTADDRISESIQATKDRTAALREEMAALGLSFVEETKRKTALDLEQEALKQVREEARKKGDADWQNAQLSPDQIAQIDAVSQAYAEQADQLRKAQEAQDLQRDVLKGIFSDMRSALDDGKLDWQDFANIAMNALSKIVDKIENDLIDAILQANSAAGGGFGGLIQGALSFLGFDSGGYTGPGGKNQPAGIVHKGEVVYSQDDVRRHGGVKAVEAMRKGKGGLLAGIGSGGMQDGIRGGADLMSLIRSLGSAPSLSRSHGHSEDVMQVVVGVSADNNGNLLPFVQSVSQDSVRRAAPGIVRASVQEGQRATKKSLPGMLANAQTRSL